jgi:hypothetical protein
MLLLRLLIIFVRIQTRERLEMIVRIVRIERIVKEKNSNIKHYHVFFLVF